MRQARELIYAVRLRVVGRYVGELLGVMAGLTVVPLLVSLIAGEPGTALRYVIVIAVLGSVAAILFRLPEAEDIQTNEALVVVASVFMLAAAAMIYPLMAGGLSFLDALFEAVSGVTTTGLSTTASVEDKSEAFLFARAWMQWYGGLGFVALSGVLLMTPGATARRLGAVEMEEQGLVGGTRAQARRVLAVYAGLTLVAFGATWLSGADSFDALVHTLSAVSTGGFSSHDDSLAGVGLARVTLAFAFIAGATPFALYWRAYRRGPQRLLADVQLRALAVTALVVAALLWLTLGPELDPSARLGHALFTGISTQTTTGFTTLDPAGLDPAAKGVLILSMFVGGGAGSTAGGIKLLRFLILLRVVQIAVTRTALPSHAVTHVRLGGNRLDERDLRETLSVILLFAGAALGSWIVFLAYGHTPLHSLFDVVSALGTVGLSTGVAGPELAAVPKLVLCADMLLGRLELICFLVLIYPRTWFGNRRGSA